MLHASDLDGRDATVTIESITAGEISDPSKPAQKATKKPIAKFVGQDKTLALNITNCRTIVAIYGSSETNDWIGKRVTLYPTTAQFGRETVEAIRIRPVMPPPKGTK